MTDNEIIKALKDEIRRANYIESYYIDCVNIGVFQNALNLINRQKAEIDGLQRIVSLSIDTQNEFSDTITEQKAEIKRLEKALEEQYESSIIAMDVYKSEAIKEFAERLKEEMSCEDDCGYHCSDCCYECKDYVPVINNVLREMEK